MIATLAELLGLGASDPSFWMPLVLMAVLYALIAAGVLFDGFDLGVGCLALIAPRALRPRMLALLSPWRDANEFWLLLALGVFAAGFPNAWSQTLGRLYFPLLLLAVGTVLRSVCFEWHLRAARAWQARWQLGFSLGAVLCAFAQGMLLARVVLAYAHGPGPLAFAVFMGFGAVAAYALLGATWLVMREGGRLRVHAIHWARRTVRVVAVTIVALSVVLDVSNASIFLRWGDGRHGWAVVLVWGGLLACFVLVEMRLQRMVAGARHAVALPYALVATLFVIVLGGFAYSFFPWLVLDDVTLWDAAATTPVLRLVLAAVVLVLPLVVLFNARVYWRVWGHSRARRQPVWTAAHAASDRKRHTVQ